MDGNKLKEYDLKLKQLNTAVENITTILSNVLKTQKDYSNNIIVLTESIQTKSQYLNNKIFNSDTNIIGLEKKIADLQASYATLKLIMLKNLEEKQIKELEQIEKKNQIVKVEEVKPDRNKWWMYWN
jgi:hypothetical protein